MQKNQKYFLIFLNCLDPVDFKNIFYNYFTTLISAGKIVKNRCGFSSLKIHVSSSGIGAVYV